MDDTYHKNRLRWGVLAGLAMMLLAAYPQLSFMVARGSGWHGAYAYTDIDELAYSAYINALIDGRPRRSDPYTGFDDQPGRTEPESLFSVQFVAADLVALPARALGLTASTAFMILPPVAALASSLAVFWLLLLVTDDKKLAAVGVMCVLCLATLISAEGPLAALRHQPGWGYLPFLRRYLPAVPFPFFFCMCALVWRALTAEKARAAVIAALLAGGAFAVLVYSYFYLWTAAAAWLACLAGAWLLARASEWKRIALTFGIVGCLAALALGPYAVLIHRRATAIDNAQALVLSHAPDLFRPSEIMGALILIVLAYMFLRWGISWRGREVILASAFALTPFVVFNQQILTGQSLQPFHYEEFVTGYLVLAAMVILLGVRSQARGRQPGALPARLLFWLAVLAFSWGVFETSLTSRAHYPAKEAADETIPVARRLRELSHEDTQQVVLAANLLQADCLPGFSSQPVLWALHMGSSSRLSSSEIKQRFYRYLYYLGVDEQTLAEKIAERDLFVAYELFGWERVNPVLSIQPRPITPEEEEEEVRRYADFVRRFGPGDAVSPVLSYLVVPAANVPDLSNLDRWYQRGAWETHGRYMLCHLKLRASPPVDAGR